MSLVHNLIRPLGHALRRLSVNDLMRNEACLSYPGARSSALHDLAEAEAIGMKTDSDWLVRHALSSALDRRDDWMCTLGRICDLADEVEKVGAWPDQPFIALGTHWGAGMPTLADLCINHRCPKFVYRQEPDTVFQTRSQYWAHRLHLHALERLGGTITLGGAYQRIIGALSLSETPVVLVDAPAHGRPTLIGRAGDFAMPIRAGLLTMLSNENIPYVFYRCGFSPDTGQRQLSISPVYQGLKPQEIADQAVDWLKCALVIDSAQWRLWMIAKDLLA